MTDAQFATIIGAVITGGGGFVAFCKWAFTQWLADRKEDREMRRVERQEDRDVLKENTKVMTELAVRIEGLDRRMAAIADNFEEISGVHSAPPLANHRRTV